MRKTELGKQIVSFQKLIWYSVWDREQTQQLNTFKNRSIRDPPGNSTLTGMCFLNEDSKSLLLTGSGEEKKIPSLFYLFF